MVNRVDSYMSMLLRNRLIYINKRFYERYPDISIRFINSNYSFLLDDCNKFMKKNKYSKKKEDYSEYKVFVSPLIESKKEFDSKRGRNEKI